MHSTLLQPVSRVTGTLHAGHGRTEAGRSRVAAVPVAVDASDVAGVISNRLRRYALICSGASLRTSDTDARQEHVGSMHRIRARSWPVCWPIHCFQHEGQAVCRQASSVTSVTPDSRHTAHTACAARRRARVCIANQAMFGAAYVAAGCAAYDVVTCMLRRIVPRHGQFARQGSSRVRSVFLIGPSGAKSGLHLRSVRPGPSPVTGGQVRTSESGVRGQVRCPGPSPDVRVRCPGPSPDVRVRCPGPSPDVRVRCPIPL
jgi:hypothetical protein